MSRFVSPRVFFVLIAALAIGGAVAACGTAPAPAPAPASSSRSSGSFNLAAIKKQVAALEQGATVYEGPTEPVKVPKHIKIAVIPCSEALAGCEDASLGVEAVAKRLGWSVTLYNGDGTPSGMNDAMQEAVTSGANAIITGAVNPAFIVSGLKAAAAKGIPVGSATEGVAPSPGGYKFDIGPNYQTMGEADGDYIIANSNGKAVFVPWNDLEYSSVVAFVDAVTATVKECMTCTVLPTQQFVSADVSVTSLGARVVDLLRTNPSIDYMVAGYDPAAAVMVPAIDSAGLRGKVKIVSVIGAGQNLAYVQVGNVQTADIGYDSNYVGYMAVYQMARLLDHMSLWTTPGVTNPIYEYSGDVPMKLYTSSDPNFPIGNYDANSTLHYVPKMQALFGLN
jgi:ribose transport system substrate-binding protein